MRILIVMLILVFIAAICSGAGIPIDELRGSTFRHDFAQLGPLNLVLMFACIVPIMVVHELGHLCGSLVSRMKVLLFAIGPFQISRTPRRPRLRIVFRM